MPPILFDSSIYITGLRGNQKDLLALRSIRPGAPVWLSAVVLEELYAGASGRDQPAVQRLERDFGHARRVLVPNLRDWAQTGRLLGRLAAEYGYEKIGQGRLTNDALIAASAGRAGIRVITANQRDFARLAEFFPFQWSAP
jgi:predicted nucleic acid-binding protein